jgi:hypothetical protein
MHERSINQVLLSRLQEERRFIQVVTGPRQVGKTTMAREVLGRISIPYRYLLCDAPSLHDAHWLETQWELARRESAGSRELILVLDEIQKIPHWSELVKKLSDEDTFARRKLKVVLLGSSSLLLQEGLSESLAGRFETIRATHWTLAEMRDGFGWDLETFILHGGFPGAAALIGDPDRWRSYVSEALIEATISRDILQMQRIEKPALLRQLFELGTSYSGQIVSYQKLTGQLQDAGNTTTLAQYLSLLEKAGMLCGIRKYSPGALHKRSSSPKLQVLDTAYLTVQHIREPRALAGDPPVWGRLVESAVGAHLYKMTRGFPAELYYWRDRNMEVDFVVETAGQLLAIEVKSGKRRETPAGLSAFCKAFPRARPLLVGGDGMGLDRFLALTLKELFA